MAKILITSDSRYPVNRKKIALAVESVLRQKGVNNPDTEVSVKICGTRKSRQLAKKYLDDDRAHNVISFPLEDLRMLGDIVVCYSLAQAEANADNVLVDTKINELISHAMLHLLGEHHDDA